MARKSKRMTLHEAIRQGQAKIARGLETGQMRSDGIPQQKVKGIPDDMALLKNREKSPPIRSLSRILAVVSGFAVLVLLLFIVWFVMQFVGGTEPEGSDMTVTDSQLSMQGSSAGSDESGEQVVTSIESGEQTAERQLTDQQSTEPSAPQGANVIVIQQLPGTDQQGKLRPVQDYFNANGVPTEMIQRSGYTMLVTRAGFDYDPKKRQGSEGYLLMQRIKQLGLAYPEATGDTKFGQPPFQDAYPLKK